LIFLTVIKIYVLNYQAIIQHSKSLCR